MNDSPATIPYTVFGRTGLRVSQLCLGTMTFGEDWGWGADRRQSREIFDRYATLGGNFIDTANTYTNGTSETVLGELVNHDRDHFVVGTKYSLSTRHDDPNAGGNHRKSLRAALEGSLRRLATDHIDVYWLHIWDYLTPVDEVLRALDDAVAAGKISYIGVSDTPAWVVSRACAIAELRGWSSFAGLQAEYSLVQRDAERELAPMARSLDLTLMPWSPLGNGVLTAKYNRGSGDAGTRMAPSSRSRNRPSTRGLAIAAAVDEIATAAGWTPSQVALAWLLRRPGSVVPIIGSRRIEQFVENIGCLDVELDEAQWQRLDEVSAIPYGFPHDFITADFARAMVHGDTFHLLDGQARKRVV
ncbi:MAG: aldo/keto reductase [Frankiaceae bacterium]|nr:aldo/keto reductase [Frankiaceae bacterium]